MKNIVFILLSAGLCFTNCTTKESVHQQTVLMAHSHNDYEREHPLFDALKCRFVSIEADIHLVNDSIYVAHDAEEIQPGRTLQAMYLDPLQERISKNDGNVYAGAIPLFLFIDIKSDGDSTYLALCNTLKEYDGMFTFYQQDEVHPGPVIAIISGNRPLELMKTQKYRYAVYDGRIGDLNSDLSGDFMPIISDNWTKHFTWNGKGDIPAEEMDKLADIVQQAHKRERKVRFWNTDVDTVEYQLNLWNELVRAGVDIINTDKINMLKQYLTYKE